MKVEANKTRSSFLCHLVILVQSEWLHLKGELTGGSYSLQQLTAPERQDD